MKNAYVSFVTVVFSLSLGFANDPAAKKSAGNAAMPTPAPSEKGAGTAASQPEKGMGGSSMGSMGNMNTPAAEKLGQDMRRLWSEHAFWLRDVIIATVGQQPDQKAAVERVMKNQEDIGQAMGSYYGKSAGEQLTKLLKEHESIGAEVITAARDNQKTKQEEADKRWHQNAQQIAELLAKWNPAWSKESMTDMMNKHLATTTDEVKARIDKNWDGDVKAFDKAYESILSMADDLTEGIVKQFPDKFSQKVGKR